MAVDIGSLLIQLFSGLSRAMMLFLLSSGLSLIFGVMNILNFAHATLWLVSAYLTWTLFQVLTNALGASPLLIAPAILVATGIMFVLGLVIEKFLIRPMYSRELIEQMLLTFSMILTITISPIDS